MEAGFWAVLNTCPADNTPEPVNVPGPVCLGNLESTGRAMHTTQATEDTFLNLYRQMTTGLLSLLCRD
jgi:hypothetical protein